MNHALGLAYRNEGPYRAAYDWRNNVFHAPRKSRRIVLYHECVHYLMNQAGLLLIANFDGFYSGLLDELAAELSPMELFDYDDSFRLGLYTESDARSDYSEGPQVALAGLELARRHRRIELSGLDGEELGHEVNSFLDYGFTFPLPVRQTAGAFLACDLAGRLRSGGLTSKELAEILRYTKEKKDPASTYFKLARGSALADILDVIGLAL